MSDTSAITHRHITVNGLRMQIAEQGRGPLVLLLHGFPESWYSWRHQFGPLADAGYRVVAPAQRGYGETDRPESVDQYTILHLAGDVINLIHALGETEATVIGHDWGAPVAWHTALFRPDLVRGVAALSVPPPTHTPVPPLRELEERFGPDFYQIYFQQPGIVDAELEKDPVDTFRRFLVGISAAGTLVPGNGFLDRYPTVESLPDWLSDEDIDTYANQYAPYGFTGGLNWYRNIDRNWELTTPWAEARITPPALFITGDSDPVRTFSTPNFLDRLPDQAPDLRGVVDLSDCGHWTQQEKPDEVTTALLDFVDQVHNGRH